MGRKTVYNDVFSEELWEKVNPDNKDLLNDFVDYKKSSNKSSQTIYQYYQAMRIFFIWNLEYNNNKFFVNLKKREIIRYFNYTITEKKVSSNRMAFIRSVLSSFSNFIEMILDDEYPNFRNIVKVTEPVIKETVREKSVFTEEELMDCLQELEKRKMYQEACYLALGMCCGARKSELLRFKVEYFKEEYIVFGCMFKTPEKIKTKGRSENGKMLYKYTFVQPFIKYFTLWMKYREENNIQSEWLFVTKSLDGIYRQANVSNANYWCQRIGEILGKDFYSHSLRHYFVTNMKRKNLPDDIIVEIVGWADPTLIKVYNDLNTSDIMSKYFDENGIKENIQNGKLTDI